MEAVISDCVLTSNNTSRVRRRRQVHLCESRKSAWVFYTRDKSISTRNPFFSHTLALREQAQQVNNDPLT